MSYHYHILPTYDINSNEDVRISAQSSPPHYTIAMPACNNAVAKSSKSGCQDNSSTQGNAEANVGLSSNQKQMDDPAGNNRPKAVGGDASKDANTKKDTGMTRRYPLVVVIPIYLAIVIVVFIVASKTCHWLLALAVSLDLCELRKTTFFLEAL